MFGFRKGGDGALRVEVEQLRAEVLKVQSALRLLQTEQDTLHDQVRRWMRRSIAAERAAGRERNQDSGDQAPPEPPSPARRTLWGARARRALRGAPVLEQRDIEDQIAEESGNGVHS